MTPFPKPPIQPLYPPWILALITAIALPQFAQGEDTAAKLPTPTMVLRASDDRKILAEVGKGSWIEVQGRVESISDGKKSITVQLEDCVLKITINKNLRPVLTAMLPSSAKGDLKKLERKSVKVQGYPTKEGKSGQGIKISDGRQFQLK